MRVDFAGRPKYPPISREAAGLAIFKRVHGMRNGICAKAAAALFVPYELCLAALALEESPV